MTAVKGHCFSAFALDLVRASGSPPDPALAEHLEQCAQCRAYLEQLDALGVMPPPVWPHGQKKRPAPRRHRRMQWMAAPLATATALVVGVLVWNNRDTVGGGAYVGVKGAPAVQVLVRSGDQTRIWDGVSPVRPGDALALRVECQGFSRIVVTTTGAAGAMVRLFDNTCPSGDAPLAFTLIPDDAPGDERITVTFGAGPSDDRSLAGAIDARERSQRTWVVPLTFPKQAAR